MDGHVYGVNRATLQGDRERNRVKSDGKKWEEKAREGEGEKIPDMI